MKKKQSELHRGQLVFAFAAKEDGKIKVQITQPLLMHL